MYGGLQPTRSPYLFKDRQQENIQIGRIPFDSYEMKLSVGKLSNSPSTLWLRSVQACRADAKAKIKYCSQLPAPVCSWLYSWMHLSLLAIRQRSQDALRGKWNLA
jgi:hypothetical protein